MKRISKCSPRQGHFLFLEWERRIRVPNGLCHKQTDLNVGSKHWDASIIRSNQTC